MLAQADKAFERSAENGRSEKARDRRIEQLQAKLATKNEVIAELLEENVQAKKEFGELRRDAGFPMTRGTRWRMGGSLLLQYKFEPARDVEIDDQGLVT